MDSVKHKQKELELKYKVTLARRKFWLWLVLQALAIILFIAIGPFTFVTAIVLTAMGIWFSTEACAAICLGAVIFAVIFILVNMALWDELPQLDKRPAAIKLELDKHMEEEIEYKII